MVGTDQRQTFDRAGVGLFIVRSDARIFVSIALVYGFCTTGRKLLNHRRCQEPLPFSSPADVCIAGTNADNIWVTSTVPVTHLEQVVLVPLVLVRLWREPDLEEGVLNVAYMLAVHVDQGGFELAVTIQTVFAGKVADNGPRLAKF